SDSQFQAALLHPPYGGKLRSDDYDLLTGNEAGFGKRPSAPGEGLAVPARQRRDGDALARGVHEPARAEVDPRVADLSGLRTRPRGAEEDEVARLQLRERDPLRPRHLSAHLVGRAALDGPVERGATRVRLKLVDAPDEARAVEAASRLDAEWRLRALARAAPDVGKADEANRGVQYALLPITERRKREGRSCSFDGLLLPDAEEQDWRSRVGGLRPGHRIRRQELEVVVLRRMVRAQPEQARDRLGAEACRDLEAGVTRR